MHSDTPSANDPAFSALFRLTAQYAQVHLHHGYASIGAIKTLYPSAHPRVIKVFQHGGYWNLLGQHTQEQARLCVLRILLVFGNIRDSRETLLMLHTSRARGWSALIAGRVHSERKPLRYLFNRVAKLMAFGKWTVVERNFEAEEVDQYVKAADALFIPRYEALNSGNVFLGFTFAKPVVGPDVGNIGEVLRRTGNPTFDPKDPNTIVDAVAALEAIDREAVGERNAAWLRQNCQMGSGRIDSYSGHGRVSRVKEVILHADV